MKKLVVFLLLFLSNHFFVAQQFSCDSVIISSIQLSSINPTVEVIVKNNNNTNYIPYPGFVILDSNGDTLAKESVNYFGIGWADQLHELTILSPINLPFNGYLELHSHFYDSLICTFPCTIDTTLNLAVYSSDIIKVFPNPTKEKFSISVGNFYKNIFIEIYDFTGKYLKSINGSNVSLIEFPKGVYLIKVSLDDRVHQFKIFKN